jgi:hypothetical protein
MANGFRRSFSNFQRHRNGTIQIFFFTIADVTACVSKKVAQEAYGLSLRKNSDTVSLWVIDLLLEPIIKRFKFHFEGNKATNRLDKVFLFLNEVNCAA